MKATTTWLQGTSPTGEAPTLRASTLALLDGICCSPLTSSQTISIQPANTTNGFYNSRLQELFDFLLPTLFFNFIEAYFVVNKIYTFTVH